MPGYTLTALDVRGIQSYVFGSNNLKHNIGASELARRATDEWVRDCLPSPSNVLPDGGLSGDAIEQGNLAAEVVYTGGGNAVILFAAHDAAVSFAKALSRKVIIEAPGIELFIKHADFDWASESLSRVVRDTLDQGIRQKKNGSRPSGPLLGLGVTADCQFTGLPANDIDREDEKRRVSAEALAKRKAAEGADKRLIGLLGLRDYGVAKDFDDFGTPGESSYIAVVHADGNGMGKRFQDVAERYHQPTENRSYIEAVRALSISVAQASDGALKAAAQLLVGSITPEGGKIGGEVPVRNGRLPFRPIVSGGDDVTFVCDGRLGLSLAEFYLREFSKRPLADGKPTSARAGIAVVKTHFPFARAYMLAEELAKSAKQRIKERQRPPHSEENLSALDWHVAASGLVQSLEQIREREFTIRYDGHKGSLLMRPLRLGASQNDWQSWEVFRDIVHSFRRPEWTDRRNKIKGLREALRAGPEAVNQFRGGIEGMLPDVSGRPAAREGGWIGPNSAYFDAIEALDFFVPLELPGEDK